MQEPEDTLRLPATAYQSIHQKKLRSSGSSQEEPLTSPSKDWGEEDFFDFDTIPRSKVVLPILDHELEDFFNFDTIPMSKVVLPILDHELEDTLRIPAVTHPSLAHKKAGVWITSDGRRVILARILRMFGFGFSSVLIGITLATAGLSLVEVSLLLSTALVGSVIAIIFVALFADRLGRRRTLALFALLMTLAGLAFAFSHNLVVLLVAAFLGTINPSSTSENTPFIAIEQAILPQSCAPGRLTDAFARYNLLAQLAGAAGGLAVILPDLLPRFIGVTTIDGLHAMFVLYALLGVATAVLYIGMTEKVESAAKIGLPSMERVHKPLQKSRANVFRLSSLFVLDAFAGGLVVQSILAFWFRQRFGISLSTLGILFSGANLLAALSLPIAARLSKRFGLLKTMVFTHLPSQILLVLVPLMPTFWLAALFLLCRQSLSKMDVPTRQVYIIELVSPEERTAAAGVTTMARSIATSMSPLAVGLLLTNSLFVLGLPFLLAGSLSTLYDLLLYGLFRKVPIPGDH